MPRSHRAGRLHQIRRLIKEDYLQPVSLFDYDWLADEFDQIQNFPKLSIPFSHINILLTGTTHSSTMKTVPSAHVREHIAQINNLRGTRVSRRAEIRNSIHAPPVIHIDYNPAPDEIIEVLHSWIEPSVLPQDTSNNSDSNNSLEIIYEELVPPDIYEVIDRPRVPPRAPDIIELDISEDSTDEDTDSSELRKSDSPILLALADLEGIETPAELREIDDILPSTPSTIEYSPSPDYSLVLSPDPDVQVKEIGSSGILDDTIPGLLYSIPDNQLLDLMKEFNETFSTDDDL